MQALITDDCEVKACHEMQATFVSWDLPDYELSRLRVYTVTVTYIDFIAIFTMPQGWSFEASRAYKL
jgi:hypothetical protein